MAEKKTNRGRTVTSRGSARKRPASDDVRALDPSEWSTASIAWNDRGDLVILNPRLAALLRRRMVARKSIEVGIPKVQITAGKPEYDPYPLGSPAPPPKGPTPLTLCDCDHLRFRLAKVDVARKLRSPQG